MNIGPKTGLYIAIISLLSINTALASPKVEVLFDIAAIELGTPSKRFPKLVNAQVVNKKYKIRLPHSDFKNCLGTSKVRTESLSAFFEQVMQQKDSIATEAETKGHTAILDYISGCKGFTLHLETIRLNFYGENYIDNIITFFSKLDKSIKNKTISQQITLIEYR